VARVGDELVDQAAPGEGQTRPDHRRVGDRAPGKLEDEGRERRGAQQREDHDGRDPVHVARVVAGRERGDAGDAGDDRADGEQFAPSRRLSQHPLADEQQHEQPGCERRLDHDQPDVIEREDLQRPAERRHPGAEQPAGPGHQMRQQRNPQRMLNACVASVQRLDGDP